MFSFKKTGIKNRLVIHKNDTKILIYIVKVPSLLRQRDSNYTYKIGLIVFNLVTDDITDHCNIILSRLFM